MRTRRHPRRGEGGGGQSGITKVYSIAVGGLYPCPVLNPPCSRSARPRRHSPSKMSAPTRFTLPPRSPARRACSSCSSAAIVRSSSTSRSNSRQLAVDFRNSGVGFVAISSNDAENYPDDAPASLAEQALKLGFIFPYLYDETQEVARAYDAACTPDFFLFDSSGKLAYRGQLDSSRPWQRHSRHRPRSPRRPQSRHRRRTRQPPISFPASAATLNGRTNGSTASNSGWNFLRHPSTECAKRVRPGRPVPNKKASDRSLAFSHSGRKTYSTSLTFPALKVTFMSL